MKRCLSNILLFYSLVAGHSMYCQDRALDTWQTVPSFSPIHALTGSEDVLFAASANGLFSYRQGASVRLLDKSSGLSDTGIGDILFLGDIESLLIGYRSGLIDLVSISDVQTEDAISSLDPRLDKEIYSVKVTEGTAYFASELGIITYDIATAKARDIFRNIGSDAQPLACYELEVKNDTLYAFTSAGLLTGALNSNLLDFTQWITIIDTPFNPSIVSALYDGSIFFSTRDSALYEVSQRQISDTTIFEGAITDIIPGNDRLLIASENHLFEFLVSGQSSLLASFTKPIETMWETASSVWVAQENGEVSDLTQNEILTYPGPISDFPINHSQTDDSIFFFYDESTGFSYSKGIFSSLDQNGFQIIDKSNFNDQVLYLDQNLGLLNDQFQPLLSQPVVEGQYTDLLVNQNRLWIARANASSPVFYTEDLDTYEVVGSNSFTNRSINEIKVSLGGIYYFKTASNELLAYDPASQETRLINDFDGIGGAITDFEIDQDDVLFITSDQGIFFFPDATFIFDNQPALEVFISSGDLLQEDSYNAIAVDPGNRKWLATSEGLWLYDEAFDVQLEFLAEVNSPLPTQTIFDLIFQESNGLLWLLTDKGLVSYQSDALIPEPIHSNVSIFPNPIYLHQNTEKIGISGLINEAVIKITTINGALVKEIQSNGGLTSWNLVDFNGKKVSPGIYLIFSSDSNGIETYVGKFLIEP